MQGRATTVGSKDATGFKTCCSDTTWQERDIRPIQVGSISRTSQVRQETGSDQLVLADSRAALPGGSDLPCRQGPRLFFSESPQDVEQAKEMCRGCRARIA